MRKMTAFLSTLALLLLLAAPQAMATTSLNDLTDVLYDTGSPHNLIVGQKVTLTSGAANNVFIGELAGATAPYSTSATDQNVAVGYKALAGLAGGAANVAIGYQALLTNLGGTNNNAVGDNALYNNVSGDDNNAFGEQALFAITTGSNNVGLGGNTGATLTSGTHNILIGDSVDVPAYNTSNYLNIGNVITGQMNGTPALNIAGSIAAPIGNFNSATTTTALNATSAGSLVTLAVQDTGSDGASIHLTGNGSTTPGKYLRAYGGSFDILNSGYSAAILHITDAGVVTAGSSFSGALSGNASTATTATNIAGGGANYIPFQSAAGTTTFDGSKFIYNPTGYSSGSALKVGPFGSIPTLGTFGVYGADYHVANFSHTGAQGTIAGGSINLDAIPTGTPAAIASGNRLGSLGFRGTYDNSLTPRDGPSINAYTTQDWTSTHGGSNIVFKTIPNGSTSRATALTLNQDQSATFTGSVAAPIGAFNSATTTSALTATSAGSTVTVEVTDTGSNGSSIHITGNGATTPGKYLRAYNGAFDILNSGYTAAILHITDAGVVTAGSSFSGAGTGLTGTAASLTAGSVTTNANLTGPVTSVGNATTIVASSVNAALGNPQINIGVDVDLNTVADYPITVPLPPTGFYRINAVFVANTGNTASLTTAKIGVFSAASGGGTAIVTSGTALSAITSNTVNTAAGMTNLTVAQANAFWNLTTIYVRVTTGQGASAGQAQARVFIQYVPVG
jgi:hypothetical protein